VEEQQFVPSMAAAGMRKRSRLIGALIPDLTWPLIPELMRGIGEVVGKTSYELILYSITDAHHERDRGEVIDRIVGTRLAAGLLAVFPGRSLGHLAELHAPDFPVVLIDDQGVPPVGTPWIGADNRVGAFEATRHLIRLGHRRIAHISGPLKYRVSHERYEGYCDALAEAGLALEEALVLEGDFMPPAGRACTNALLDLPEERRPTAIFAGSDYMAYGAIAAIEQRGLRVPGDVAVVGFDDNPSSAHMEPALTTVRQPFYEMGRRACELLLALVDAPRNGNGTAHLNGRMASNPMSLPSPSLLSGSRTGFDEPLHIKLPTTFIVRASCGASLRATIE
jgi:LacI family transcriptional regulator